MQNILDIQNDLKNTSDEHLVNLMQMPEPNFPQYLVLSEMDRRKEMRESYDAAQASQPTVAQQLTEETANSGVTQGLGSLDAGSVRGAEMISNATDMPVIYGNRPIRSMANGGRTGYQNIGRVNPDMQQSHEDRNPEEENFWIGKDGVFFDTDNPVDYALAATLAIPIGGWAVGGTAKLSLIGGRLIQKGIQAGYKAALPHIQRGIGSFASRRGFVPNYGGQSSIPLEQMGAQYIKSLGSRAKSAIKPYLPFGGTVTGSTYPTYQAGKFLTHTLPIIAGGTMVSRAGMNLFGDDDTTTTPPPPPPPPPPPLLNGNGDQIPPPFEVGEVGEVVTEDTGRRDDINTALVSLARIASAKPNELGNILASAGKDVATAKRERRRDELSEKLIESQSEYYKARAESAGFDKYKEAEAVYVSAHKAFDKLTIPQQSALSPTGKVDSPEAKEAARQAYIMRSLASGNLLEAWQEYQSIIGGSLAGPSEVIQTEQFLKQTR